MSRLIMHTFTFIMDGNVEGGTSADDSDITPSRSCEPQDQYPSTASVHAQPANSPPQLPSEILDIGKLLKLSVELKKLSREQIHRILMAEPSADHHHIDKHLFIHVTLASVSAVVETVSMAPL